MRQQSLCIPLNGVTINMTGMFPNIGAIMPPAHPQCRCVVAFEEITPNLQPSADGGMMRSGDESVAQWMGIQRL